MSILYKSSLKNFKKKHQFNKLVNDFYSDLQLNGCLSGKKIGYVKEGFKDATKGVNSVIDSVIVNMGVAEATVEEISIPLHTEGKSFTY